MEPRPALSPGRLAALYDRLGSFHDLDRVYIDPALALLVAHADFPNSRHVVEIGLGTGRFAERLLREVLPADSSYLGFDLSRVMVGLASDRLAKFGARACVRQSDVVLSRTTVESASCDRFIATYVLNVLDDQRIDEVLESARRVLRPGGLLCLANMVPGTSVLGRLVVPAWHAIYALRAELLGGCRLIRFASKLAAERWEILTQRDVSWIGLTSEVIVARAV